MSKNLRMGLNHSQSAANKIYTTFLHHFILNSRLWLKSQAEYAVRHDRGGAEMGPAISIVITVVVMITTVIVAGANLLRVWMQNQHKSRC